MSGEIVGDYCCDGCKDRRFGPRVKFNWGFHDAAQAVREGWDNIESNYGFAKGWLNIRIPADVLTQHFCKRYAEGWLAGLATARSGLPTDSSEPAWKERIHRCGAVSV